MKTRPFQEYKRSSTVFRDGTLLRDYIVLIFIRQRVGPLSATAPKPRLGFVVPVK